MENDDDDDNDSINNGNSSNNNNNKNRNKNKNNDNSNAGKVQSQSYSQPQLSSVDLFVIKYAFYEVMTELKINERTTMMVLEKIEGLRYQFVASQYLKQLLSD